MKLLIRLLARLYPGPWRAKYGPEFDALLTESRPDWRAALNVVTGAMKMQFTKWGYARFAIAGILIGIVASSAIAFSRQPQWRSEGVVYSRAFERNLWDEFTRVAKDAITRSSLTKIILADNLYADERRNSALEDVIQDMRKHIRIAALKTPGEVSVQYEYRDRFAAQRVVSELMSDMIRANLDSGHNTMQLVTGASLPAKPYNRPPFLIVTLGLLSGLPVGVLAGYVIRRRRVKA
jgi:hypothetical protein